MRRRFGFAATLATVLLVATGAVGQPAKARIAWFTVAPHPFVESFRRGLRELGWNEGENLEIEYHYARGEPERIPEIAAKLGKEPLRLVVASGSEAVVAAQRAITAIPIVAVSSVVGLGDNLARPSGNLTGISLLYQQTAAKWVEILGEAFPKAERIGAIYDTSPSNQHMLETAQKTASVLGKNLVPLQVLSETALAEAIDRARRENVQALIFFSSPLFTANADRIAALVQQVGVPAMYEGRVMVEKGGLMSYGPDLNAAFHRVATHADKILKGASPADVPIEQPTRFEFVLNLRVARALRLDIPTSLLLRADEVIE